ncbi:right-handed parallel beta-helix repeat-containing protein [Candidatus Saccharibacteria bacterium]|nr:MAG: right-handed parallel beta-helix repeat-containing protein [Candidatus Saccharibacteria bacterium]
MTVLAAKTRDIVRKLQRTVTESPRVVAGLAVLIFAAIGTVLLVSSHAATPTASYEAESGALSGNASLLGDASASGSSSVKFSSTAQTLTCSLHATTANFAAQVTAATAGQVICLASGDYGTWTGTNKAITITKQAGATANMDLELTNGDANFTIDGLSGMGGTMTGNTIKNITIRNSTFSGAIVMMQLSNANVLLDNNVHNNIDVGSGCTGWPARVMVSESTGSAGVTVTNSLLSGGNSDGIKIDSDGVTVIGNQFIDIKEKNSNDCAHTDSIQFNGAGNAIIRNNYFRGGSDGIVAFDTTYTNQITNNVCVSLVRGACVTLYSDRNSVVEHNVAYGGMDALEIDHKSADPVGSGTIFRNNIGGLSAANGSTVSVNTKNLFSGASGTNINGTPTYVGGTSPTTWEGFKLAAGSAGKGAATDGLDVGIN